MLLVCLGYEQAVRAWKCRKGKLVIQSAMPGQCPKAGKMQEHSLHLLCSQKTPSSPKGFVLGDGFELQLPSAVCCSCGAFLCFGRGSVVLVLTLLPASRFCNLLCSVLKLGERGSSSVYNSLAQQFPWTGVRFLCSPGDPICLIWAAAGGCVDLLQWNKRKK